MKRARWMRCQPSLKRVCGTGSDALFTGAESLSAQRWCGRSGAVVGTLIGRWLAEHHGPWQGASSVGRWHSILALAIVGCMLALPMSAFATCHVFLRSGVWTDACCTEGSPALRAMRTTCR